VRGKIIDDECNILRSYGVVLWEMSTYGDTPYSNKQNEEVVEFVKEGGRLKLPENSPVKL
jgi:hypothetical protein